MILTYGDLLHPYSVVIKNNELQIRLFNLIPIRKYSSTSIKMPIRTNYLAEDIFTYFKYFSLLACWKNKKRKPVYRVDSVMGNDFSLLRLTDSNLHRLRSFIQVSKVVAEEGLEPRHADYDNFNFI